MFPYAGTRETQLSSTRRRQTPDTRYDATCYNVDTDEVTTRHLLFLYDPIGGCSHLDGPSSCRSLVSVRKAFMKDHSLGS